MMKSQSPVTGNNISIEVFADVICPWCYIGKRRLGEALAQRPNINVQINWRCFLLNPTMPDDGMPRAAYLAAKFGHSAAAVYGRIAAAGLDSGISFNFDKIARTPSSRKAQKLLLAAGPDTSRLSEALYEAYFIAGLDIGDEGVLFNILTKCNRVDLMEALVNDKIQRQLESDITAAHHHKLDGVPYFIFGEKFAIAGAHMPEHLIPAIDAATV
jgi:predicted DsbA family dithiol-disulfide isomerase